MRTTFASLAAYFAFRAAAFNCASPRDLSPRGKKTITVESAGYFSGRAAA
ncbi:MAG: hypothetical protein IPH85_07735 [Ignavibacteria bacterium]|nr:hypothetical protein [Ignavibacteria bacterium]